MKIIVKSTLVLLILLCSISYGQMEQYNYKRELKGISEQWHKLIMPTTIFGQVSESLSDIRILGVTNTDTIEAPYIIRERNEQVVNMAVDFKRINASKNDKGYYFTFEILTSEVINQIKLEFNQQDFDWKIKVEGSQNQQEWFTVIENYRILSIQNQSTNFQFTTVNVPSVKYKFIRFFIESKVKPGLTSAGVYNTQISEGVYRDYSIKNKVITENKEAKQTEIEVELNSPVPVNQIFMEIDDTIDYYRFVTIEYLTDSFETEKGWKYNYRRLTSGTLNSLEENRLKFGKTKLQKFKIIIQNQDNQPLTIASVGVKGVETELIARFTETATYFLVYGNKNVSSPNYDISRFSNKIPIELTALHLGNEMVIEKEKALETSPIFENKNWLWAILVVMIGLMGWFSIKMISKK